MSTPSPAPGTPQSPRKAILATAGTFVASLLAYWIADVDPLTGKEIGEAVLTGAISAGVIGGGTYAVANRPSARRL